MYKRRYFHVPEALKKGGEEPGLYDDKINLTEDAKCIHIRVKNQDDAKKIAEAINHSNHSMKRDSGLFDKFSVEIGESNLTIRGDNLVGALDHLFNCYYISEAKGRELQKQILDADIEENEIPVGTYSSSPVAAKKPVSAIPQTNGHHSPPVEVGKKL